MLRLYWAALPYIILELLLISILAIWENIKRSPPIIGISSNNLACRLDIQYRSSLIPIAPAMIYNSAAFRAAKLSSKPDRDFKTVVASVAFGSPHSKSELV